LATGIVGRDNWKIQMNVAVERVRAQIASLLTAWGMDADLVQTTVDAMMYSDLAGIDSHGVSMLMQYEDNRLSGRTNVKARPRVVRETPVTALVDAGAGLGHAAAVRAMELAIDKALAMGVAVVSVFNSHHFGPAGYYAALAPKRGLIGLVTTSTHAVNVVPTHSSVPVLGTNPIAFAAPARRNPPFLLDMSTSTVAANKVKVYDLNHEPLPAGWMIDANGSPVLDAALGWESIRKRRNGGLTPLGGTPEMANHKGYGLGMMVQILSSTLGGGSFSPVRNRTQRPADPDNIGHFLMAIDPGAFRPDGEFEQDLDAAIDVLHAARPADPGQPVLVAGDPEQTSRKAREQDGIPIPTALAEKIKGICERAGVPFLLAE
jgi:LDH2 family malate/lactate/ureidoglycolate dehydrogenase